MRSCSRARKKIDTRRSRLQAARAASRMTGKWLTDLAVAAARQQRDGGFAGSSPSLAKTVLAALVGLTVSNSGWPTNVTLTPWRRVERHLERKHHRHAIDPARDLASPVPCATPRSAD